MLCFKFRRPYHKRQFLKMKGSCGGKLSVHSAKAVSAIECKRVKAERETNRQITRIFFIHSSLCGCLQPGIKQIGAWPCRRRRNLHKRRNHRSLLVKVNQPMTTGQRANVDQWRRSAMNTNQLRPANRAVMNGSWTTSDGDEDSDTVYLPACNAIPQFVAARRRARSVQYHSVLVAFCASWTIKIETNRLSNTQPRIAASGAASGSCIWQWWTYFLIWCIRLISRRSFRATDQSKVCVSSWQSLDTATGGFWGPDPSTDVQWEHYLTLQFVFFCAGEAIWSN